MSADTEVQAPTEPDASTESPPLAEVPAKPVETAPPVESVSDIDRIDPVPTEITLSTGYVVDVQPMKSRQFFKMLRIVTHGGSSVLPNVFASLSKGDDEDFVGQLIGLLIFSIPEAENETIEFVQSMLLPKELTKDRRLDEPKWQEFYKELANPELDDLFSIVEVVVRREAPDLKALGSRLGKMMNLAVQTGQVKVEEPS